MTSGQQQASSDPTCEQLVHSLACFLRASFVYPATDPRVAELAEAVLAGFDQHRDGAGMLRLSLHRDQFRVGQHRVQLSGGDPAWMGEVFLESGLAGVQLAPALSLESLALFAARLQTNFQDRETTDFQLRWSGPFAGLQPLEPHFEGERFFAEEVDTPEAPDPDLEDLQPAGSPEDKALAEELQTLAAELAALPGSDGLGLDSQVDLKDEMLGILLHRMVTAEDDSAVDALAPQLSRLVREAHGADKLLGAYLDWCKIHRGKPTERRSLWRVAEFIQEHGFANLLGHDDLLRTDTVAFAFPYLFNQFLDSLVWGNDDDLSKIGDVCYDVGPERIREAKEFLLAEGGVLVASRTRKILAKPNRAILPLAEIILEDGSQWITPLAVEFLKQLKMPGTASLALRTVRPVSMLPRSYLIGLCRAAFEDGFSQELMAQSVSLACGFIRSTADDPGQHERRLFAIQSLRSVRSQDVLRLLRELKNVCGPLSLNRELRAVRRSAIEVLDYHARSRRA